MGVAQSRRAHAMASGASVSAVAFASVRAQVHLLTESILRNSFLFLFLFLLLPLLHLRRVLAKTGCDGEHMAKARQTDTLVFCSLWCFVHLENAVRDRQTDSQMVWIVVFINMHLHST
mmetsp:Transcript_38759/g.97633  ORF Transcript_38759/g.97633 Transcript_38759/m.97633 type:complete len:118 (+) Transcript_38759:492-845(+)